MLAPFSFSHITASSLCYEEIMKSRYAVPYTERLFVSLHKKWIVSATTRVSRAAREEHCFKKWHVKGNKNLFFKGISRWNPFWKMKCSQIRGVIRLCYIASVLTEGCWDSHSLVIKPTQKSTLSTNRRGHLIMCLLTSLETQWKNSHKPFLLGWTARYSQKHGFLEWVIQLREPHSFQSGAVSGMILAKLRKIYKGCRRDCLLLSMDWMPPWILLANRESLLA